MENENDYILVEGDKFRVCQTCIFNGLTVDEDNKISLDVTHQPIKDGVSLEQLWEDGNYLVIAFIKYNLDNKNTDVEDIERRLFHALQTSDNDDLEELDNCLEFARQAVLDCNG